MKSFTYRIEDPNGMHARPAGTLAAQAKKFNSEVTVRVGEKKSRRQATALSDESGCHARYRADL
jgi:phosphocarrier protein